MGFKKEKEKNTISTLEPELQLPITAPVSQKIISALTGSKPMIGNRDTTFCTFLCENNLVDKS